MALKLEPSVNNNMDGEEETDGDEVGEQLDNQGCTLMNIGVVYHLTIVAIGRNVGLWLLTAFYALHRVPLFETMQTSY